MIVKSLFLEWRRSVAIEVMYSLPSINETLWIDGNCSHDALPKRQDTDIQRSAAAATANVQQASGSKRIRNSRLCLRKDARYDTVTTYRVNSHSYSLAIRNSVCAIDVISS